MISASLSSLYTWVFLLERRYLSIDGESNDALGALVSSDTPEKLQPARIVLGIEYTVRALLVTDYLIQFQVHLPLVPVATQKFTSALALGTDHSWLGTSVEFIVIAVIYPSVSLQVRHRTCDVRFHFQLTEDVQSKIIAAYRHFVAAGQEVQFRRVIE